MVYNKVFLMELFVTLLWQNQNQLILKFRQNLEKKNVKLIQYKYY